MAGEECQVLELSCSCVWNAGNSWCLILFNILLPRSCGVITVEGWWLNSNPKVENTFILINKTGFKKA